MQVSSIALLLAVTQDQSVLLLHRSSPSSGKGRSVPFSRANHLVFAHNAILISDLNYPPPSLSKGTFSLVHKTCILFFLF